MNKVSNIKIFTCGGTFEKVYDSISGELTFKNSIVEELIAISRVTIPTNTEKIMLIDSLEMNKEHREKVSKKIAEDLNNFIVLVHGTDTMIETAKEINLRKRREQIVILTGAMVPFALKKSDAFFNFGCAITALNYVSPGIYIAMNGKIFNYLKAKKNKRLGVFEEVV